MPTIRTALLFSSLLIAVGCTAPANPDQTTIPDGSSSSPATSESPSQPITKNVNYTGTVRAIGVTIYMQGTHKLELADGRFILLTDNSHSLNLDQYIGQKVSVHGSVQPTAEAGGTIMYVETVTSLEASSADAVSSVSAAMCGGIANIQCPGDYSCVDNPTDSCDPNAGGADCGGICIKNVMSASSVASSEMPVASSSVSSVMASSSSSKSSSSSSSSSKVSSSVSASSVAMTSSSASVSSAPGSTVTAAQEQQIVLMSKQNYTDDNLWSQKYCTSHIGFCIPVHKQWYYQSFGSHNSLWHVEFGMSAIDTPGQGVLNLDLVSGLSASKSATNGQVVVQGNTATGYRDWDNGRHFEITGDVRLQGAIAYMIAHIEPYTTK